MLAKRYHLPIGSAPARPSQSLRSVGLTLKVFLTDLPYGRFGIIIPKAVIKTAVGRNRLKRTAFEVFSVQRARLAKYDLLCIASKGAPLTKDAMIKELSVLLSTLLRPYPPTL